MAAACQARVPGHSTGPVHDARAQSHAPATQQPTPAAQPLQPPLKSPPLPNRRRRGSPWHRSKQRKVLPLHKSNLAKLPRLPPP
eukprot:6010928-Amphidinium_carterae.1